jgi:glutathione synthase/RimK-type ligase-like ATP-grasp enzyme
VVLEHGRRSDVRTTAALGGPSLAPVGGVRGIDIVVISELDDGDVPLVRAHLSRELIVLDPAIGELTFERGGGRCAVIYAGRRLDAVRSVWYRKPMMNLRSRIEPYVAAEHRRYAREAMSRHAALLRTEFRRARWVSDYLAIIRAENKALQLKLAHDVGLLVPETIITSSDKTAAAFIEAHPATIIKTICAPTTPGGPRQRLLATRVHGVEGLEDELPGLRWAPSIFQQAIDTVADLRLTVVGNEVFTASLEADPSTLDRPGVRDWRDRDKDGDDWPRFRRAELPAKVRRACVELTRRLGLEFAAIDLVVDRGGTVWFLELNPNGQWGFIEVESGLPIGAALAELLERG